MTTASTEAYAVIVSQLPRKRAAVYASIGYSGGSTIREACAHLAWPYNTVSARIFELAESGLIKDTGLTRDGQTVWIPSRPDEVDALRAARKATKRFEAGILGYKVNPETFGQPDDFITVEVRVPRTVWNGFKTPIRVRFL